MRSKLNPFRRTPPPAVVSEALVLTYAAASALLDADAIVMTEYVKALAEQAADRSTTRTTTDNSWTGPR